MRRTIERVRIEKSSQRAGLQPVTRLEDGPEEVLPTQHPVSQQVETRLLLHGDELGEIALDLLVHGLLGRAAPIEVARRLDEPLRARVNPGSKSFHRVSRAKPRAEPCSTRE